jgi:hypothetical protein
MMAEKHGGEARKSIVTQWELACLAGTSGRVIERLVRFEIIEPVETEAEQHFPIDVLPLVARALRIREHLGVSWSSLGLVLDLIERIERLESRGMDDRIGGTGTPVREYVDE